MALLGAHAVNFALDSGVVVDSTSLRVSSQVRHHGLPWEMRANAEQTAIGKKDILHLWRVLRDKMHLSHCETEFAEYSAVFCIE